MTLHRVGDAFIADTARVLETSTASVERSWRTARAWLRTAFEEREERDAGDGLEEPDPPDDRLRTSWDSFENEPERDGHEGGGQE